MTDSTDFGNTTVTKTARHTVSWLSLSIVDKNIISAIRHFVEEMNLDVDKETIHDFLQKNKKRRSIQNIYKDTVIHICSFIDMGNAIAFLTTCKQFAAIIPNIWRVYEHMYYNGSTLSSSGATMISVKQNIAIDWFDYIANNDSTLKSLLKEIQEPEKQISKLKKRNDEIYNSEKKQWRCPRPSPQTKIEYITNLREMVVYEQDLGIIYDNAPKNKLEFIERFRWLCPEGLFYNMPLVDDRLYTGIRKNQEEQEDSDWDSY